MAMASNPASARAWRLVKERRVIVPPIRGEASFGRRQVPAGRPVTPSIRGRGGCSSTPPGAGDIRVTIGRGGTGEPRPPTLADRCAARIRVYAVLPPRGGRHGSSHLPDRRRGRGGLRPLRDQAATCRVGRRALTRPPHRSSRGLTCDCPDRTRGDRPAVAHDLLPRVGRRRLTTPDPGLRTAPPSRTSYRPCTRAARTRPTHPTGVH